MTPWIKGILGVSVFFGIILGYVFQSTQLSGYFDLAALIKNGMLLGTIVGGLLGFLLYTKGKDQDARFSIYAGMLVLGVVSGPLLLSIANRWTSSPPTADEFELLEVQPVMHSNIGIIKGETFQPDAHIIKIKVNTDIVNLQIEGNLDRYILEEDSIVLNVRHGGLGFNYVDHTAMEAVL